MSGSKFNTLSDRSLGRQSRIVLLRHQDVWISVRLMYPRYWDGKLAMFFTESQSQTLALLKSKEVTWSPPEQDRDITLDISSFTEIIIQTGTNTYFRQRFSFSITIQLIDYFLFFWNCFPFTSSFLLVLGHFSFLLAV